MTRSTLPYVSMLALLILAGAISEVSAQVRWLSGASAPSGQTRSDMLDTLTATEREGTDQHVVIQFDGPLSAQDRAILRSSGVTPLTYLGDHAFFAAVDAEKVDRASLSSVASLKDAQSVQRDWKLHPDLVADVVHPCKQGALLRWSVNLAWARLRSCLCSPDCTSQAIPALRN